MYPYFLGIEKIPMYGVCFIVGIVASSLMLLFYVRRRDNNVNKDDSLYGTCFAMVGGIIGAKLLSILTNIPTLIENNLDFVTIMKNGFVFYGGMIGGFFGYLIYAKIYKLRVLHLTDQGSQILPMGHAIGRLGCFCSGCCYGRPTDSFLGVVYTNPSDPTTPIGIKLLPTQLFEVAYCLIIFLILFVLNRKFKFKRGVNTTIYVVSYAICRFINEFFRYDTERGSFWIFSTSQWISIFLILALIVYWIIIFKNKKIRSAI